MTSPVAELLAKADHVLVAFDGPVNPIPDAALQKILADRLKPLVRPGLPRKVAATGDPLVVLAYARTCGAATEQAVERHLRWLESEAHLFVSPTPGAVDALRRLFGVGHTITIVGNHATETIRSYLVVHDLLDVARRVSARDSAIDTIPVPDPFLLNLAVKALGTSPDRCVFVAGSVEDIEAGRAAGIPVIAYADNPRASRRFSKHGADVVIGSMTELDWLTRSVADVVPPGDLLTWRGP